jgi:hypothetical protein
MMDLETRDTMFMRASPITGDSCPRLISIENACNICMSTHPLFEVFRTKKKYLSWPSPPPFVFLFGQTMAIRMVDRWMLKRR